MRRVGRSGTEARDPRIRPSYGDRGPFVDLHDELGRAVIHWSATGVRLMCTDVAAAK
jgi:hypothetical protein